METALGFFIPIKNCDKELYKICKACVTARETGLPEVKKDEPKKPVEKKHDDCKHCVLDMEKWLTKARRDSGKSTITEYMDSIGRNGATLLADEDQKFNNKMSKME